MRSGLEAADRTAKRLRGAKKRFRRGLKATLSSFFLFWRDNETYAQLSQWAICRHLISSLAITNNSPGVRLQQSVTETPVGTQTHYLHAARAQRESATPLVGFPPALRKRQHRRRRQRNHKRAALPPLRKNKTKQTRHLRYTPVGPCERADHCLRGANTHTHARARFGARCVVRRSLCDSAP